jgi:hypothetical protein
MKKNIKKKKKLKSYKKRKKIFKKKIKRFVKTKKRRRKTLKIKKTKNFKTKKTKNFKTKKTKKLYRRKSQNKEVFRKIIRFGDNLKPKIKINFNLDNYLQKFFQKIADKIDIFKQVIEEEREKKKQEKIKIMQQEKNDTLKKSQLEKKIALEEKIKELKDEEKIEKNRKKELQKFIRVEQAEVRKEQAAKQKKFLEQIKLEKKIEQFRKREAIEIKNLEKFVLGQERDSYTEVQERIEKIKQKYQALRDQKIRERVEQLGIDVREDDDRTALLEKERNYNLERQKIEFSLESFYRSAHSLCFQINKRYIPKYLSILRVIDRRFETGEIFIKWDDSQDEDWLILIYIKNNSPEEGIVIEDKTNPKKNTSSEFKSSEIFKASDMMVDSLTNLLDRERKKRKNN